MACPDDAQAEATVNAGPCEQHRQMADRRRDHLLGDAQGVNIGRALEESAAVAVLDGLVAAGAASPDHDCAMFERRMSDQPRLGQCFLASNYGKGGKRVEMGDGPWAKPCFKLRGVEHRRHASRSPVLVDGPVTDVTLDLGYPGPTGR